MEKTKEEIKEALRPVSKEQLKKLSRSELEALFLGEQSLRIQAFEKLEERYRVEGLYIILKKRVFGPSSEKSPKKKPDKDAKPKKRGKDKNKRKPRLPSERYPDAEIVDFDVVPEHPPACKDCGESMKDTGLTDVTESLTVIPKTFRIERHHHHKYKCSCCQSMFTTPRVPRIKPGSSYSDEMIIDVAMSKYCDLIPIQRYAAMAGREGFFGIPPQSLIELTHYLAHFTGPIVDKIKKEIFDEDILHADETPHRMMEQKDKKKWYLWGFSTLKGAYFECQPSRSGDIAAAFLKNSKCSYLMSDVYTGYAKGVRLANEKREKNRKITIVYCNAHARRKFWDQQEDKNAKFFIWCYRKIYRQQQGSQNREWQQRYFRAMKRKAERLQKNYPMTHGFYKAMNYFLSNYESFTVFLTDDRLPIDNNSQERLLRSPVVGRKTWYGTHSLEGGKTAAAMFTIVESCKLNKVNPRTYLKEMVKRMHKQEEILTPFEAKRDFPQIFFPN